jgi:hypothetical protein
MIKPRLPCINCVIAPKLAAPPRAPRADLN